MKKTKQNHRFLLTQVTTILIFSPIVFGLLRNELTANPVKSRNEVFISIDKTYNELLSQRDTITKGKEETPSLIVEQMPEFPGGEKALLKFLEENLRYPEEALKGNIQGTVYVHFFINKIGKVERSEVVKGIHPLLDAEALRLINSMPDWSPATQGGKPLAVFYTIPVKFSLQETKEKITSGKDHPDAFLSEIEEEPPFVIAEQMPQFPGGEKALLKYLEENLQYPEEALKGNIQGTVNIRFVINVLGKVQKPEIARGVHPLLDAEALRLINTMPNWIPGKQGGKPVPFSYAIPVKFEKKKTLSPITRIQSVDDLLDYLNKQIIYPNEAREKNVSGVVKLYARIDKTGYIYSTSDTPVKESSAFNEIVIIGYKTKDYQPSKKEIDELSVILKNEGIRVLGNMPKIDFPELQGTAIQFTFKFELQ